MAAPIDTLTEREKRTLRLLLDGHDAKSIARALDLSVHTINERLRDARRKLSVSSSREAARLLRAHEAASPDNVGDTALGDAPPGAVADRPPRPGASAPTSRRAARAIGGLAMLSFLAAALALSLPSSAPRTATAEPGARTAASDAAAAFLALVDDGRWTESWAATGDAFRALNSKAGWEAASMKARQPLGAVVARRWLSEVDTPSPPSGYTVVRFRTDFVHRRAATETLSLDREGGGWKVVGIYIE